MVARTETEDTGKLDTLKLVIAIALLVAGIAQFYYFEGESLLYRVLGILGFVALAGGVMYTTRMGQALWAFAVSAVSCRLTFPLRMRTSSCIKSR